MNDEAAGHRSDSNAPLLDAIGNLSRYHREHEKFYASAPREQAVQLQRHARALLALADRWSTVDPDRHTPFSPYEGAPDLNATAAIQLDGILFMEGEGEPTEITHLTRDLRTLADDAAAIGEWLATAVDAESAVAIALVGQEPQLSLLAGWLLTGEPRSLFDLRKGGACLLELTAPPAPGTARLLWLLEPRQARRLAR